MAAQLTWPVAIWGALGVGALVRAFWNPARVVSKDGAVLACPGNNCDPAITLGPSSALYAVTPGRVYQSASGIVAIASGIEPVLITYAGAGLVPAVAAGADVRTGVAVAHSSTPITFAVQQVLPGGKLAALEPASWLAARGFQLTGASGASPLWCAAGRKILVPRSVASCGFRLPDPASVLLLPVSTTTE